MKIEVGQTADFSKKITEHEVYLFAEISGDYNSVHVNKVEAEKSRFGKQIVHGALINSYISTVLEMKLPGEGTIYLSQNSRFLKPVFFNDTITVRVQVKEINGKKL